MPTDNDWRVLRVIVRAIVQTNRKATGEPPSGPEASCALSFMDIGEESGVHPMNVRKHVRRLEERGLLRRDRATGTSPTIYHMTLSTLGVAYVLLDAVVGMNGPWPSQGTYKY